MSEEIFDTVLLTTGHFRSDVHTYLTQPPPDHFNFNAEFWIGSLPHELKQERVLDACDAACFNFKPVRQFGMRYAFCRKVRPTQDVYYRWDDDGTIGITLFLSRLIRPTTIANSTAARLYFEQGELKTIVAGPTQGLGAHAWVVAKDDYRDWLDISECEFLHRSALKYNKNAPDRVRRARKHIDHAFHAFYLDQRFASLVTAFESLLKVSPYQSTKQFAARAPKLAKLVGYELNSNEAESMYRDRSAFVHGAQVSFQELSDELIEQYERFERVIRRALLLASTDSKFSEMFATEADVLASFGDV